MHQEVKMSAYSRRLVNETENIIRNDPTILQNVENRDDLVKATTSIIEEATRKLDYTKDTWLYRIAIITLSLLALTAAGAAVATMWPQITDPVPESLVALGSAAAGALVGLFAKPPSSSPSSDE